LTILIKYLFKLSLGPVLIGLGGFIVFVSVEILYQLSDLIVRHRVSFFVLLRILYYYLPYFTALGVPVGILLAVFWVLSKLSNDRELMAMQVHGISMKVLIVPFLLLGAMLSFMAYVLNDRIVPVFNQKADQVLSKYVYRKPEVFISENVLTKVDENQYFYVKKYDRQNGVLENVVLFRNEPSEEEIITARRVTKEGNKWFMYDGRMYRVDKEGFLRFDVSFSKVELDLKQDIESILRTGKTPRDMKSEELRERISTLKKLGIDPAPWVVELHSRYSIALGPIIIALVGVPLSLMFNLRSKSWGVILTFVLIVLYQGSGAWISAMGKENLINPVLAAWLPDLGFGLVGTVLFILLDTHVSYRLRELLTRFLAVLFVILLASHAQAATMQLKGGNVVFEKGKLIFSQGVEASYEDVFIRCSTLTAFLNESNQVEKILAEGNVSYNKKDTQIRAQQLYYVFSEKLALIVEARGKTIFSDEEKVKHTVYFSAKSLQMKEGVGELQRSYLTTCDLEQPHYRLQATNVAIKENDYLAAYNVVLFIFDVPTVYFPVYFVSLREGPQPFSVKVGYSKSEGFSIESVYNLTYPNGYVSARVGFREKGDKAGNYSHLTLNYKASEWELTSNLYNLEGPNGKDHEINATLSVPSLYSRLTAYFSDERFSLQHTLNPVKDFVIHSSITKTQTATRWTLPSVSIKKFTVLKDPFSLVIHSFSHVSSLEYTEGSLFDHLDEFYTFGRYAVSAQWKLPKVFKQLDVSLSGAYELRGTNITSDYSRNYFQLDSNLPFKTALLRGGWFDLSFDSSLRAGVWFAQGKDLEYLFSQTNRAVFTVKPFDFFSVSVGYGNRSSLNNVLYSRFSDFSNLSKATFSTTLKVPTTSVELSTGYDLIGYRWDDLLMKTRSTFDTFSLRWSIYTETIYQIEKEKFYKTDWDINVGFGSLNHETKFTYRYDTTPAVDVVENKMSVKGKSFLFMERPDLSVKYTLSVQPFDILIVQARGSFYTGPAKHAFSLTYMRSSYRLRASYELSNFDPSVKISFSGRLEPFQINSLELTMTKDLHCWGLVFETSFSTVGGFSLEKLSFKFFIKEFPKKSFSFDPITGSIGADVF